MSYDEWEDLPWWERLTLIEGLENEQILKGSSGGGGGGGTGSSSVRQPTMDLTNAGGNFSGFKHRSAK